MTAPETEASTLSAECTLALRPAYIRLHRDCRQTEDIPLPGGRGVLLQRRCGCSCHRYSGKSGT
ncbi:MAG: hypothetical protein HOZ81_28195 [Streptomyces sp.]|nr:hypothetical protein [Streptomyces sp.]